MLGSDLMLFDSSNIKNNNTNCSTVLILMGGSDLSITHNPAGMYPTKLQLVSEIKYFLLSVQVQSIVYGPVLSS